MNPRAFRELLAAVPFRPFRVVMSNGAVFEIPHPEYAGLARMELLVYRHGTGPDGQPGMHTISLSLLHVVQYDFFIADV